MVPKKTKVHSVVLCLIVAVSHNEIPLGHELPPTSPFLPEI